MNWNEQFIEALQALFKDREVEITVTEVDETEYLLRSKPNRERLLQAIKSIDNGKDLVEGPLEMLQWFEAHGIGRKDFKIKRVIDE